MKSELKSNGELLITAENELEAYALRQWWDEYLKGVPYVTDDKRAAIKVNYKIEPGITTNGFHLNPLNLDVAGQDKLPECLAPGSWKEVKPDEIASENARTLNHEALKDIRRANNAKRKADDELMMSMMPKPDDTPVLNHEAYEAYAFKQWRDEHRNIRAGKEAVFNEAFKGIKGENNAKPKPEIMAGKDIDTRTYKNESIPGTDFKTSGLAGPRGEKKGLKDVTLPYGVIFEMDGSHHVFSTLKRCWCDAFSKSCKHCGGYMHYQSVHDGDFYRCEGCKREES